MALLADHENLWEINRQLPAITLGAWFVFGTFLVARRLMRGRPSAWHSTREGIVADLAMVGAGVTAVIGSIPRSESGSKTCGPVLYEWRTSASGCGETLATLRFATLAAAACTVGLLIALGAGGRVLGGRDRHP